MELCEPMRACWGHLRLGLQRLYRHFTCVFIGVKANEISLKFQKPLLTRWWHINVCNMQVMESYKAWVDLFEHMCKSRQSGRLSSIDQNVSALGKSKNLKCKGGLFCVFSRAYWESHVKWLHRINEVANIFGHSSPLMLVHLMLVLEDMQEVKTMQSSNFDHYKDIRECLPDDNHDNGIYSKEIAKKQAKDFFE